MLVKAVDGHIQVESEVRRVLQSRTPKELEGVRVAHTDVVTLLAAASESPRHSKMLTDNGIPEMSIPIVKCGKAYATTQIPMMLGQCLPFARRGVLNVFAHAVSTPEEEVSELRLAAALGMAGYLVLLRVPLASKLAAAAPSTHFLRVAPNVMLHRTSALRSMVVGVMETTSTATSPVLLLGDPTIGIQEHVEIDALAASNRQTMLLVEPDGTEQTRRFHQALLCSSGLGLALVASAEGEAVVSDLPSACNPPMLRIMHAFAGLEAVDAFAAQIASVLSAHPDSNAFFKRGSESYDEIRYAGAQLDEQGVVPQRDEQCGDTHGYLLPAFLQRCLPGRRGVYMQSMTIPFDLKLYQRPQHMATAMAKLNMLVLYVQFNRAVGQLQRSAKHPNIFLADLDFEKVTAATGMIVNVYSTMFMFDEGAVDAFADAGNTVVYEYIDAIDEAITGNSVAKLQRMRSDAERRASLITYSAKSLLDGLSKHSRPPQTFAFVPNGVDPAMYVVADDMDTPPSITHIVDKNKPIVGYFGAIAPWIWMEAILKTAQLMPDVEFLFIGPAYGDVEIPDAAGLPENLHFHPPVAASDLVLFGRHFTVGFIPFRMGEIAKTTSPLKLFEYFALGLPTVVTSDMVECTRFPQVRSADSVAGLVKQLRSAIQDAADEGLRSSIYQLAADNSWDRRAQTTLGALTIAIGYP